ncbi:MAG: hypothetical protein QJR08_00100 [Bacillota bacterium]|nr:hypothetical protein [Bacillota bacterium]
MASVPDFLFAGAVQGAPAARRRDALAALWARPWRWIEEDRPEEPAWNLALDEALAEWVGAGEAPPFVRLWTGRRSLVTSRYDPGLVDRRGALAWCRAHGYDLLLRSSGGGAVVHCELTLNLSIGLRARDGFPSIAEAYELLPAGLLLALAELGVEAGYASVPGSFCDGRWNLAARGRKLAGTAQRRRAGYVLWHAVLLAEGGEAELARMSGDIEAFYRAAGAGSGKRPAPVLDPSTLTTVEREWRSAHPDGAEPVPRRKELAERIRRAYDRLCGRLSPEAAGRKERERARELAPSCLPPDGAAG